MSAADDRPCILLVDDEPCIRSTVGRILEYSGYRVLTAATGAEALALVERERFQAVICDLRMPGLCGVELFERLRQVAPELAGRIVVVSGDLAAPDVPQALSRAGVPSLAKPFGKVQLLQALAQVCPAPPVRPTRAAS